jgi:glycosyltransferase involved in cell wall biosynthesis
MFKNGHSCKTICSSCKPFFSIRKQAAKQVDLFLANSAFVKDHHKKFGFLPENVPCEVQFNANTDDYIAKPKKFPNKRNFVVGFIGRVTQTKGIEVLLDAFSTLEEKNIELKIAGKGSPQYIEALQARVGDDRISYLGFTEPDEFYKSIDLLVCPSTYDEPLPRVVYEAYREAVPVIAAKTGGTPEIVDHGKTGFLYEAADVKTLSKLIANLCMDKEQYEMMSIAANNKAQEFKASTIADSFARKLEGVLNNE